MYGMMVGVSCLIALGVILGASHYIISQSHVGALAASYENIVRIEAFQLPVYQAGNVSMLGQDAKLDQIELYTINGVVTAIGNEDGGWYSVAGSGAT